MATQHPTVCKKKHLLHHINVATGMMIKAVENNLLHHVNEGTQEL